MTLTAGMRVTHRDRPQWGTGTVLRVSDFRGLDGRWWVLVRFDGDWTFHAELENLEAA